jgi:uncharacterized RDD family membrane protein YckC
MTCEKCGEVCRCPTEPPPTALPGSDLSLHSETSVAVSGPQTEALVAETPNVAWRNELSARLHRYRARRKPLPPRYPSLHLPFDTIDPSIRATPAATTTQPVFDLASSHALALDGTEGVADALPEPRNRAESQASRHASAPAGAKIIEFPRFAWGPPPPLDQLAEPVVDRPRILEVPEVPPPPPALGGITIEPARVEEPEKRPGIDIPLQTAPLGRRLFAGLIDGLLIVTASALFGCIFWKVTGIRPPHVQLVGLAIAIPCLFWAAYQYLLIVYGARTPGIALARLELKRFDGTTARRSLRRWRVLASWLSAASLGMGYAWLFLDEGGLCWHDRITRTYLAPSTKK